VRVKAEQLHCPRYPPGTALERRGIPARVLRRLEEERAACEIRQEVVRERD
jgi:hypothetical protein